MNRGVTCSRRLTILSLTGVGAACALALVHHHLSGERIDRRRHAANLEDGLARLIAGRSDCDDRSLLALRARVGKFRGQLGPEDSWQRLIHQFGTNWAAEAGPKDDKDGYSYQVGTFLLLSPSPSDWPGIVAAVAAAELVPGVAIVGFEMKSSGDNEHRSMDLVKIAVAIHTRRAPTNP